jgi:hypothetical protein
MFEMIKYDRAFGDSAANQHQNGESATSAANTESNCFIGNMPSWNNRRSDNKFPCENFTLVPSYLASALAVIRHRIVASVGSRELRGDL